MRILISGFLHQTRTLIATYRKMAVLEKLANDATLEKTPSLLTTFSEERLTITQFIDERVGVTCLFCFFFLCMSINNFGQLVVCLLKPMTEMGKKWIDFQSISMWKKCDQSSTGICI